MNMLNVLIVDDETGYQEAIEEFLQNQGYTAFKTGRPTEALKIVEKHMIDIAILDLRLPEMSGTDLLAAIHEINPDVGVIMISGHGDMDDVIEAMRMGAIDFFRKPFKLDDIRLAIERTVRHIGLKQRLNGVETSYQNLLASSDYCIGGAIIGSSPEIQHVRELTRKIASTPCVDVLITGESGVGKELAARDIFMQDTATKGVFYDVNCPSIPETLFESEAFGHRKNAFTGADIEKKGFFEIANEGTLFLDEIGELSPTMQSKLLRVLEERKIRKIGSSIEIHLTLRVIASTNRNLDQMVMNGSFRRDLFYRLNRFSIHIPTLRERRSDIPALIEHFNCKLSQSMKRPPKQINPVVMQALINLDFPGNIRELRNILEKALILSDNNSRTLDWNCFPDLNAHAMDIPTPPTDDSLHLDQLELLEISLINRAMKLCDGNKAAAAKKLGITRASLHRRIEKHKLRFD